MFHTLVGFVPKSGWLSDNSRVKNMDYSEKEVNVMNKKDILRYVAIGLLGALTALSTQINNESKIEKEVTKRLAKKEES